MSAILACPRCSQPIGGDDTACAHCGEDVSRVLLLETLREETLGDYEVLAELGAGGMASVFLAHDIALNRKVALKVMLPALLQGRDTIERFKREAQTAASLSHPHIIPIYAVKEGKKLFFIVMKCVEGRTLGSIIDEVGQLPLEMVQAIVGQVGGALGYAHRRGVVHRDIKPDNVMIDNEGWAVVTDFGIAKVLEATNLTATGAAIGTPAYMSPEQCSGEPVSGASDQYALGSVAYEMLTGKPPFMSPTLMGMMWAHVNTPPLPVTDPRPDCPPDLAGAVLRMLAKKPEDRFPTVEEAVAEIGVPSLAHDDPVRTSLIQLAKTGDSVELIAKIRTPSSPIPFGKSRREPQEETPRRRTAPIAWIAAVAAVLIGGTATVLALRGGGGPSEPAEVTSEGQAAPEAVQPIRSIDIATPERPIGVGETVTLSARLLDADGRVVVGDPPAWESSDPDVAAVSPDGVVTGVTAGVVRITARTATHSATTVVLVGRPPGLRAVGRAGPFIVSVQLQPATRTLAVGDTARFVVVARDRAGAQITGRDARWETSDSMVVAVSGSGVATGLRPGLAVITGTVDERPAQATVIVGAVRPTRIELAAPRETLVVGSSTRLAARLFAADGSEIAGRPIRWSSSDETVARVASDGLVSALDVGRAEIAASSAGRSATQMIVVQLPPTESRPVPAVPAGPEIEAVIREYARALAARDVDGVKRVYPDLPADRERTWLDIFALGDLTVTVDAFEVLEETASGARASFTQTIEGRRLERNTTSFVARLVRTPDGWRIVSIR